MEKALPALMVKTNTAIGVVDNEGKVLVKDSIPTPTTEID